MKKEYLYNSKPNFKFLLIFAVYFWISGFISLPVTAKTFYVATNGNDANPGTITKPFRQWQKLTYVLNPGDTAFIRGGSYSGYPGSTSIFCHFLNLKGTIKDSIYIFSYPDEHPVLDLSKIPISYSNPTALVLENCYFLHISGLRITGLSQIKNGSGISRGLELRNSSNNLINQIEIDQLGGYGFIIGENSNHNLFLNCDAHHLSDPYTQGGEWSNANGFQCTGGTHAIGNIFNSCRAWWISDDGYDLFGVDGDFTFINCWSFWNGYKPGTFITAGDGDGFKLGPASPNYKFSEMAKRTLKFCIAAGNRTSGFDQNKGDFRYSFTDNISQQNGFYGYMFDYIHPNRTQQFTGNISFKDKYPRRGNETNGSKNSWDPDFKQKIQLLQTGSLAKKREKNGNLPKPVFIKIAP